MTHSLTGTVHLAAALAAVVLGALVLARRKGGTAHRLTGYAYALAMLLTNVTALLIYRLTGRLNFLHVFAAASLATLLVGLGFAVRRRPAGRWLDYHYTFMAWSYIGLLAALVAESATRLGLPLLQARGFTAFGWFWAVVGGATFLVCGAGAWLIRTRGARAARLVGSVRGGPAAT